MRQACQAYNPDTRDRTGVCIMSSQDDMEGDHPPDPKDAADEAFLFALARVPTRYGEVTDIEAGAIAAWSQGRASPQEEELARTAIRANLAAKEFLLSLRLEQAAAAAPPVSAKVSQAILRRMAPPVRWNIRDFLRLPFTVNWQIAGVGAVAAAAILAIVVLKGPNEGSGLRFQVAALGDRSVLGGSGGTVTRGAQRGDARSPSRGETLEWVEFDMSASSLRDVFAEGTNLRDERVSGMLAREGRSLSDGQDQKLLRIIFDRALEAEIRARDAGRLVTLRAYDLGLAANKPLTKDPDLARAISVAGVGRIVFITMAP